MTRALSIVGQIVDTDGFLDGQLVNNNTITFCYKQAGGRTESSVVSCSELKRTS